MTDPIGNKHQPRAWRSGRAWAVVLIVAALGLLSDLWSKDWAFANVVREGDGSRRAVVINREDYLQINREIGHEQAVRAFVPTHKPVVAVPGLLNYTLVLNDGAVFGIGPGQRAFFLVFTPVALLAGLSLFAFGTGSRDHAAHAAIGLLIAGGLGNLYDRLFFGCVRDFIHPLPGVKFPFGWKLWTKTGEVWPYVNNVADLWLIVGIGVLLIVLWKSESKRPARHAA